MSNVELSQVLDRMFKLLAEIEEEMRLDSPRPQQDTQGNTENQEQREMGKDLGEKAAIKINVAEIVHHGEKVILPEKMTIDDAIELLKRRRDYLQETVKLSETYDVFPWDGANALNIVLARKFGWSPAEATPGFFGPQPPRMISIDTDYNKKVSVPWGAFSIPGHDGRLNTGVNRNRNNQLIFELSATVLRSSEEFVMSIFKELREELKRNSIYRGKALKMRFRDEAGNVLEMPTPEFINTTDVDETFLVFSGPVHAAIETNLFTPIRRVTDCLKNDIPVKRGVLLGGSYGTGKTLAAKVASKFSVQEGLTYVYVARADELSDGILFAKQYQSPAAVVFCEDIDRAMAGERSVSMDEVLNVIDGIDTKNSNIIVVLTTNDLEKINPAMLRPGRLDAVIEVGPPDGPAVEKLLRIYGVGSILPETKLERVGLALAGNVPAVVAEVVKRAKLAQLKLEKPGARIKNLSEDALLEAAETMTRQIDLLKPKVAVKGPEIETALRGVMDSALIPLGERLTRIEQSVN